MRRVLTLANERMRQKAVDAMTEIGVDGKYVVRPGSRVEIKGPKRSNDQNAAHWAMLGDISEQLAWHGRKLDAEAWKLVFLDALRRSYSDDRQAMDLVPNTDGTGFVDISGKHSSDLSGEEMHDLLTIIRAFGDQHQVEWSEPAPKDAPADLPPSPPIEAYEEPA